MRRSPLLFVFLVFVIGACHRSCNNADTSLDPCIAAMDPSAADRSGRHIATACAPLYERKPCRKAIVAAWQDSVAPADRPHIMVDACREAYCPALSDPKPALCTDPSANIPLDQYAAKWRELNRAILEHDLGKEKADRLFAAREAAGKKHDAGAVVDAGPPARVELRGTTIVLDDARVAELTESDAGERIEALQAALKKRSTTPDPSVVFDLGDDVSMGTALRLIGSATYAGHHHIAFAKGSAARLDQGFARSITGNWATVDPRSEGVTVALRHGLEQTRKVDTKSGEPLAKTIGELKEKDKIEQVVVMTSCSTRLGLVMPALDAAATQKVPLTFGPCSK